MTDAERIAELEEELTRVRARLLVLEARYAFRFGTHAPPAPDDEPAIITHDIPPNAPR